MDFYENQKPGLGYHFADEVDKTLMQISAFPEAWHHVSKDVRRCLVGRFPYGIMYAIEPKIILVLSVFNLHRNPENIRVKH